MPRQDVPDNIIERGVEIWCRALAQPSFDNGDAGSALAMFMAAENAERDAQKVDRDALIEAFRVALIAKLKFLREHDGKLNGETLYKGHPREAPGRYWFDTHLSCDYGPGAVLGEVAKEVGLPSSWFSFKSHVNLDHDRVEARFGYGAPSTYHYPLPKGGWLITALRGDDMPKIMQAVEDGRLPELEVEAP